MSITPGYKSKRRFMQLALRRPEDSVGEDYISNGATPLAMQTKGLGVEPWITEQVTRDLDDGKNGAQPVIHTGEMIKISGAFEMAGSGTANTPVAFAAMLQMAGMDQVTQADKVVHSRILNAASETDGTIYFWWEGMYHILLAGKASLSIAAKVGEIGYINFEAQGVYGGTLSGSIPQGDFSAFTLPEEFSKQNTSFSLDGQALNCTSFEMAQNNSIELDEGTEVKQIFIDDWDEEVKVTVETPELATFDPFAIARSNTFVPLEFTQGITAGRIFKVASTAAQIITITPGEHKGKATWELTMKAIRGNDCVLTTQ
ncbi:hypothetical protein [Glaciecola sp. 1036]|uniref:hypothetical protein n=1 Tax=Alteromonadaceae TaxID=72275 RepID=UPI003D004267